MKDHGPEVYILPDGVHHTSEGNRVVAEAVEKFLAKEGLIARLNKRTTNPP